MKAPVLPKNNKHAEFFGKLFEFRNSSHLRHLKPSDPGKLGSGWQHSALGSFYDEILDIADGLIETYQGKYGLIDITVPASKPMANPIEDIRGLAETIENGVYESFKSETWMQNQLDGLTELCYHTVYKLENLK